jgi:hypothetical protein
VFSKREKSVMYAFLLSFCAVICLLNFARMWKLFLVFAALDAYYIYRIVKEKDGKGKGLVTLAFSKLKNNKRSRPKNPYDYPLEDEDDFDWAKYEKEAESAESNNSAQSPYL